MILIEYWCYKWSTVQGLWVTPYKSECSWPTAVIVGNKGRYGAFLGWGKFFSLPLPDITAFGSECWDTLELEGCYNCYNLGLWYHIKKKKKIPKSDKYITIYMTAACENILHIARTSSLEHILFAFGGGSTVRHAKQQSEQKSGQSARLRLISSAYDLCKSVEQLAAPASLSNCRFLAASSLSGTCNGNATEVPKATN